MLQWRYFIAHMTCHYYVSKSQDTLYNLSHTSHETLDIWVIEQKQTAFIDHCAAALVYNLYVSLQL